MNYTNIELKNPLSRSVSKDMHLILEECREELVNVGNEKILVSVHGDRKKKAIITYHDIGLNYASNFQSFFNYSDIRNIMMNFCVYHVNAPGQNFGAQNLPENYSYPSIEELSSQLSFVLSHFGIKSFIGFGVGAGANILLRYAILNPNNVDCLCLINCVSTVASWMEWGYQKINIRQLKMGNVTQSIVNYLMWHHFGNTVLERNPELYQTYQYYFQNKVNPYNLALFMECYLNRTDLNIMRESDVSKRKTDSTLEIPVLNITGDKSPHESETVTLNGRINPEKCSWMKISDCAMPLEEQPGKVAEAFRLFVQGIGYISHF